MLSCLKEFYCTRGPIFVWIVFRVIKVLFSSQNTCKATQAASADLSHTNSMMKIRVFAMMVQDVLTKPPV